MKKVVLMFLIVVFYGCSGTVPTSSYQAQNIVRYQSNNVINLGTFKYAQEDRGLKANQIRNTAIGTLYTDVAISTLVKRVTGLELEKTGFALNSTSNITISGIVLDFLASDLGFSVRWRYSVQYMIHKDGEMVFTKEYKPDMKKTGKFGNARDYSQIVHEMVLSGYELFITDPEVKILLEN